jgi:ABC-type phosphate transport system substrate-binding protein
VLGGLLAGIATARAQSASYQVIVNAKNPASWLSRQVAADMFLKKVSRWEHGEPVRPVDQAYSSAVRQAFSKGVLRRTTAAVRHYWTQRIFSGRELPPPEVEGDDAVVRYVASHVGAVGYVAAGANLAGTKPIVVRDT